MIQYRIQPLAPLLRISAAFGSQQHGRLAEPATHGEVPPRPFQPGIEVWAVWLDFNHARSLTAVWPVGQEFLYRVYPARLGLALRGAWNAMTDMPARGMGWNDCKALARAILHERAARRKVASRLLLAALLVMAAGLWVIDNWLATSVWWFLAWWAACGMLACLAILFALYDALAVVREERNKLR
jgi:hypothetical protein